MVRVVEWLNAHSGEVSAIAAIVSALATIVVAALTIGTFALYRLEKRREQARTGAIDAALILIVRVQGLGETIVDTSGGSKGLGDAARQMILELRDINNGFERAYQALSSSHRRWARGTEDYHDLLEEFTGFTRSRVSAEAPVST